MTTSLEKCPSCARHIRQSEDACPFCAAALPASFRVPRARPVPSGRLSRAALWALSASAVGALPLTACGSDDTSQPQEVMMNGAAYGGSSPDYDATYPTLDAAYGGPGLEDAATDGSADATPPSFEAGPLYGSPPHDDGGFDGSDFDGGDGGGDASHEDSGDADTD